MEKYLTIIIPSYNVEKYIQNTVSSIIVTKNLDKLEIIIVNDGSVDNTLEIANQYAVKYPDIIKVINKENGGYGSALNSGIEAATGKYLRILDGDDTIITGNLEKIIKFINSQDGDLILSEYILLNNVTNSRKKTNLYKGLKDNIGYSFDELKDRNIVIHSAIFKTSIYKKNNIIFDEHCMYTDNEYVIFALPHVHKISFFSLPLYEYHVGVEGQSVSAEGWKKYEKQHEKVFMSLLGYYLMYDSTENEINKKIYIRDWINRAWQARSINGFLMNNSELQEYFLRWSKKDRELLLTYNDIFRHPVFKEIMLIRKSNYSFKLYLMMKALRSVYRKMKRK